MWRTTINEDGWTYGAKFRYAQEMGFQFRIVDGDDVWHTASSVSIRIIPVPPPPDNEFFNPFYTNIVFVHNEQQAVDGDFPDNVILAWPRDEDNFSQRLVGWMNYFIKNPFVSPTGDQRSERSEDFALEDFNLSYPITVENLVDNWEDVQRLWNAFGSSEQSRILSRTQSGAILPNQ